MILGWWLAVGDFRIWSSYILSEAELRLPPFIPVVYCHHFGAWILVSFSRLSFVTVCLCFTAPPPGISALSWPLHPFDRSLPVSKEIPWTSSSVPGTWDIPSWVILDFLLHVWISQLSKVPVSGEWCLETKVWCWVCSLWLGCPCSWSLWTDPCSK